MTNGKKIIEAKGATEIAKRYMATMLGISEYISTLEEVELSEDEKNWLVTIGYPKTYTRTPAKEYKLLKIDAVSGKVISMKIRRLNDEK